MTLPASGAISMLANVRAELGLSGALNLENASVRTLYGIASGAINMKAGYGKSNKPTYRPNAVVAGYYAGSVTNPSNAWDSNPSTYAMVTGSSLSTYLGANAFHGFPAIAFAGTLYVNCLYWDDPGINSGSCTAGNAAMGALAGVGAPSYNGNIISWPISTSNLSQLYIWFTSGVDGKGDSTGAYVYDIYCQ